MTLSGRLELEFGGLRRNLAISPPMLPLDNGTLNTHMSHISGSDVFSHNLLSDRARELIKPSKNAENLLLGI